MNPTPVQFVGGRSDGVELIVDELRPNFYFAIAPDLSELLKQDDYLDFSFISTHTAVYVLLEGSTIYVFKRIQLT